MRGAVVEMPDCPHSLGCSFSVHSLNHLGPEGGLTLLCASSLSPWSLSIFLGADTTMHPLFPPSSHPSSWAVQPLRVLPAPASPELRRSEPMIHKGTENARLTRGWLLPSGTGWSGFSATEPSRSGGRNLVCRSRK